MTQLSGHW
ncbi:hypothetical protein MXB_2169 [Myxobolus squamalis]|nr:hypothetical protein MXB_2169 [Myxobolus squamalis]